MIINVSSQLRIWTQVKGLWDDACPLKFLEIIWEKTYKPSLSLTVFVDKRLGTVNA